METKTKTLLFNLNEFSKSRLPVFILVLIFIGTLLPIQSIQAAGWETVGGLLGAILSIGINIFSTFFQVFLVICNVVVGIAGWLLGWVTGPYFTTLPYTHGGIVDIGWPLVRDIVNMFFIIALVVIGLATALRIREYQAQKTLPTLIIIAILINFTPVICGAIIDAANIIMNFFLDKTGGFQTMINFFTTQGASLVDAWTHPLDIGHASGFLGRTIIMIIFDLVASYIFFVYALLFILRYIMIWTLVIISPIAFFSKILPGSQKYIFRSILGWDEWWKQFIEWSLLGIIASFFIYLGEQLIVNMPSQITKGVATGTPLDILTVPLVEFINGFLPWLVVIIFLWCGYRITKETSALGAQEIIKAADTGIKIAGTSTLAVATLGAAATGVAQITGRAASLAARGEEILSKPRETKLGKLGKGIAQPVKWGVIKPAKWATRNIESQALNVAAQARRIPEPEIRKIEKLTPTEAEGYITAKAGALPKIREAERLQYAALLAEKGSLGKTSQRFQEQIIKDAKKLSQNPYYKKDIEKIIKSLPEKATKELLVSLDQNKESEINRLKEKLKITDDQAAKILMAKSMKPQEIPKINSKFWQDPDIMHAIQYYWDANHYKEAARKFGKEFIDAFTEKIKSDIEEIKKIKDDKLMIKSFKSYIKANPARAKYLESNAAQEAGFISLYEIAPKPVKKKYKNIREITEESVAEKESVS